MTINETLQIHIKIPMYTTLCLDALNASDLCRSPLYHRLIEVFHNKRKIVIVVGSGISVSTGIPSFVSLKPQRLHAEFGAPRDLQVSDLFSAHVYNPAYKDRLPPHNRMIFSMASKKYFGVPDALPLAEKSQRILRVYTQNIDDLEERLVPLRSSLDLEPDGPWPITIRLHGSLRHMYCEKCGDVQPLETECSCCKNQNLKRAAQGKRLLKPGYLRPRIKLYDEPGNLHIDGGVLPSAIKDDISSQPDALIVVGTRLHSNVHGASNLVRDMAKGVHRGPNPEVIWINDIDPPPPRVAGWTMWVKAKSDDVAKYIIPIGEASEPSSTGGKHPGSARKRTRIQRKYALSRAVNGWSGIPLHLLEFHGALHGTDGMSFVRPL